MATGTIFVPILCSDKLMLFKYGKKPKILFFVDSLAKKIIAQQYQKYLTEFEIVINDNDWLSLIKIENFDILCHTNLALLSWKVGNLDQFIKQQHKYGTKVVLFDTNQIYTNVSDYEKFDAVFLNNQTLNLKNGYFIPEAVDLKIFGPDIPFEKRPLKIACRRSDFFWQKIKSNIDIQFVEVFDKQMSQEALNDTYNKCRFFYGIIGCMEASACGVIPLIVSDKIFPNILNFKDEIELIKKLTLLKDDPDTTLMSHKISKQMLLLDYRFLAQKWGESIEKIILKKKAVYFT